MVILLLFVCLLVIMNIYQPGFFLCMFCAPFYPSSYFHWPAGTPGEGTHEHGAQGLKGNDLGDNPPLPGCNRHHQDDIRTIFRDGGSQAKPSFATLGGGDNPRNDQGLRGKKFIIIFCFTFTPYTINPLVKT